MLPKHKPKFNYNGLTIIMSNASRFDLETIKAGKPKLISGVADWFFNNECLQPETNRHCSDIRLLDDSSPILEGTKSILVLGQRALSHFTGSPNSLDEQRGSPLIVKNIPCIASYLPQDCLDQRDYESRFNKEATGEGEQDSEEADAGEFFEVKGKGRTARSNYRFWLKSDVKKALRICKHGIPEPSFKSNYEIYGSSERIIDTLTRTKNQNLYIDIETDFLSADMRCFAFNFSDSETVFVVPTLDWNYKPAYEDLHQILKALCIAFRDNCVVAHNGAIFDFFIFAFKYRIPVGRSVFDTLICNHRIFPEIEKSLGHCIPGYEIIDTVSGKIPIKDLVGKENFYVWSWKDKKPFPAKVKKVFKTRENAELIRINCWRKAHRKTEFFHIDCTPDHLIRLRNGKWIEAKNLICGNSLTRVKIHYGKSYNQYDRISYSDNIYPYDYRKRCHKYIYECIKGKLNIDEEVHHKDENKWNNEPDNLSKLHQSDHRSYHSFGNKNAEGTVSPYKGIYSHSMDINKVIELYNSGMSQREIGLLFNTTQGNVRHFMKVNGFKSRTQKEGQQLWKSKNNNCTVISIKTLLNKEDVYCMEIEDTNCFSCNGVIIHNCISYWTYLPYHKDEGAHGYRSQSETEKLWSYCGKDVYSMRLVHEAQLSYAAKDEGLMHSINTAMASIRPYLIHCLTGVHYNEPVRQAWIQESDKLMMQYLRCMRILHGESVEPLISNKKCAEYFHNKMGYTIVSRTKTGGASLAADALLKLRLRYDNPVIDFLLAFRKKQKEVGVLNFRPWIT